MYIDDFSDKTLKALLTQLAIEPDSKELKHELFNNICKKLDNKLNNEINNAISIFIPDETEMQKALYREDIVSSIALYGVSAEEYFEFDFPTKNHMGRSEYFCDKQRFKIFRPFYNFDRYEQIRNKWNQYNLLQKYFKRECVHIENGTITQEIREFVSRHNKFVLKPVRAFHGDGVKIINRDKTKIEAWSKDIEGKEYILDELIIQDDFFKVLHPESLNTIRVLAIHIKGTTTILHPQLHIGRGSSVADNDLISIRANIDADCGVVYTPGYDHYKKMYIVHPDTDIQIVGLKIPAWVEMKTFVSEVMDKLEGLAGYIGFDLAYTKKGWTIVEINPFPQFYSQQLIDRKGYRKEIENVVLQKISDKV